MLDHNHDIMIVNVQASIHAPNTRVFKVALSLSQNNRMIPRICQFLIKCMSPDGSGFVVTLRLCTCSGARSSAAAYASAIAKINDVMVGTIQFRLFAANQPGRSNPHPTYVAEQLFSISLDTAQYL